MRRDAGVCVIPLELCVERRVGERLGGIRFSVDGVGPVPPRLGPLLTPTRAAGAQTPGQRVSARARRVLVPRSPGLWGRKPPGGPPSHRGTVAA